MTFRTRFAPSPTGPLHLGHAFSALLAHDMARARNGFFLLRIEDIDRSRARSEWETQIYEDLDWLGIQWDDVVLRQSDNISAYRKALETLWSCGLLYPCYCNRRDIMAAASAPQEGTPLIGPDGVVYPGTCRERPKSAKGPLPDDAALRLDLQRASALLPSKIEFLETGSENAGRTTVSQNLEDLQRSVGDVVLCRRDMGTSYHLSVVIDDAAQGITEVVRGEDLFDATAIHVLLQHLLGLPKPTYHHHRLIRDDCGKRLAKRDDARAISKFRAEGKTPEDIRRMVGLTD